MVFVGNTSKPFPGHHESLIRALAEIHERYSEIEADLMERRLGEPHVVSLGTGSSCFPRACLPYLVQRLLRAVVERFARHIAPAQRPVCVGPAWSREGCVYPQLRSRLPTIALHAGTEGQRVDVG